AAGGCAEKARSTSWRRWRGRAARRTPATSRRSCLPSPNPGRHVAGRKPKRGRTPFSHVTQPPSGIRPASPARNMSRSKMSARTGGAFIWLLRKEWRELFASRAWWVMLVLIGPLVGVSFISAVQTYAELSGLNGTAAGVGEAFSPLIGVWAPTFSACELAAAFLLPFVAIRLVGG